MSSAWNVTCTWKTIEKTLRISSTSHSRLCPPVSPRWLFSMVMNLYQSLGIEFVAEWAGGIKGNDKMLRQTWMAHRLAKVEVNKYHEEQFFFLPFFANLTHETSPGYVNSLVFPLCIQLMCSYAMAFVLTHTPYARGIKAVDSWTSHRRCRESFLRWREDN